MARIARGTSANEAREWSRLPPRRFERATGAGGRSRTNLRPLRGRTHPHERTGNVWREQRVEIDGKRTDRVLTHRVARGVTLAKPTRSRIVTTRNPTVTNTSQDATATTIMAALRLLLIVTAVFLAVLLGELPHVDELFVQTYEYLGNGCTPLTTPPMPAKTLVDKLPKKCMVVVGGSTGMGLEMVRELALAGARVVLTGRSQRRAEEAVMRHVPAHVRGNIVAAKELDLADATAARAFGKFISSLAMDVQRCPKGIGALFLHGGMSYMPGYNGTFVAPDGKTDYLFASNVLGYVAMLEELAGTIKRDDPVIVLTSSIVSYFGVASDARRAPHAPKFADRDRPVEKVSVVLDALAEYGTSKLVLTMLARDLAERRALRAAAIEPGLVLSFMLEADPAKRLVGNDVMSLAQKAKAGWPLAFSTSVGAEKVLATAASLALNVRPGVARHFLPYALAPSRPFVFQSWGATLAWGLVSEYLQKLTARPGKLFACSVPVAAAFDEELRSAVRAAHWPRLDEALRG